jgi:hypothetical protein
MTITSSPATGASGFKAGPNCFASMFDIEPHYNCFTILLTDRHGHAGYFGTWINLDPGRLLVTSNTILQNNGEWKPPEYGCMPCL